MPTIVTLGADDHIAGRTAVAVVELCRERLRGDCRMCLWTLVKPALQLTGAFDSGRTHVMVFPSLPGQGGEAAVLQHRPWLAICKWLQTQRYCRASRTNE